MKQFVVRFRKYFAWVWIFSFAINLLLLVPSLYMLQVYDRVLSSRSIETLIMLTIIAIGALVILSLIEYIRSRVLVAIGAAIDHEVSPAVLKGLMQKAASMDKDGYVYGLRDVSLIKNFIAGAGIFALFDAPWAPVYLAVIYLLHPALFVVAAGGAVVMFALAILNEKLTHPILDKASEESRTAGRYIETSMRNAEVVGAMGMIKALTRRWSGLNASVVALQAQASKRAGAVSSVSKFVRSSLQMLMLGTGAYYVIHSNLSSGFMIAAMFILGRALAPVEMAISTWKGFVDARDAYARLSKLFAAREREVDGMELPAPRGELSLEKVYFGFKGTDKTIIKGITFSLAAGESLGIIGPSAAGKSTLARLITGVWKPLAGTVRLDGADINTWDKENLGGYLGYLPQDVELFSGSVADNIARLAESAPEAVIAAAERAWVHDMILRLPAGYDTEVGAAGVVLSGGQRQRVALARALFGPVRLVVLDEPNANLDAEGEASLLKAMKWLKDEGITTIVITHKPSLLIGVDKMLFLRDGVMELFGPRDEIMAKVTAPPALQAANRSRGN